MLDPGRDTVKCGPQSAAVSHERGQGTADYPPRTGTAVGGDTREEMEWVNDNPLFCLVESGYIWDVRVIA